jgi:CheY-like chemotaxis protein
MERILIIDDSDTARALMRSLLEQAGYVVLDLPSAIGATRTIQREQVSMVIVDVHMPGMTGDSLIGLLRMHPRFREIMVVVVSGQSGDDLEALRERCGADAALPKTELQERLVPTAARLLYKLALARIDVLR